MGPKLRFVTSNKGKLEEAKSILKGYGVIIEPLNLDIEEARSESCAEVALRAADEAFARAKRPLFVEDSGLFVNALSGFPGAFSKWALGKIGNEGMLRLMQGRRDRRAKFTCALAYRDAKARKLFVGECAGKIALKMRGAGGFGYDPIFVPNGSQKTFAQDAALKARASHRRKALDKFAKWYSRKRKQKR